MTRSSRMSHMSALDQKVLDMVVKMMHGAQFQNLSVNVTFAIMFIQSNITRFAHKCTLYVKFSQQIFYRLQK